MTNSIVLSLTHNAALLLSMVLMFEILVWRSWERAALPARMLVGALLGFIGMAVMLTHWEFMPGLFFDARSILLAISGLFFGGVPTLVAMIMTSALRIYQGGIGIWVGVPAILASGLIGLGWRRWLFWRRRSLADLSLGEIYAFGLMVHGVVLLLMLVLPLSMALDVITRIGPTVLLIYPIATLLLAVLMVGNVQRRRAETEAREEIAQRERAERALRENEQRLRSLINSTPDIICFKDGQGRWLEANEADLALFSLNHVDYHGKTDADLADFTHPIYRDAFLACEASDENAWRAAAISRGDETIPKPDGTQQVFDVIKVPLFESDGRRKALTVLGREITERKRVETERRLVEIERDRLLRDVQALNEVLEQRVIERTAELEAVNRELDAFSYSISHDLRAPLRAITGFAQALARRQRDRLDDDGRQYLDNVLEAGRYMECLIEDLLHYSRTGRGAVRAQPVALGPIAAGLISTFGERIAATGADLDVREPLAPPPWRSHPDRTDPQQPHRQCTDVSLSGGHASDRPRVAAPGRPGDHRGGRQRDRHRPGAPGEDL